MKSFLNFGKIDEKTKAPSKVISIVRNGVKLEFVSTEMEKGSKGVYPGLNPKGFDLENFISFRCKNIETSKDTTLRQLSFNGFVLDAMNEIAMSIWKDCVASTEIEYDAKDKATKKPEVVVSDETFNVFVKSFEDTLNGLLNGETKQRERNSAYYAKQAETFGKLFKKETNPEKKASLRLQAVEAQKMSKTLAKQEAEAMDSILESILE